MSTDPASAPRHMLAPELGSALIEKRQKSSCQPLALQELEALVKDWRIDRLKIGFTCGVFDLLHVGHVHYLNSARALCDRLIVAVNSDNSVRSYKGPLRPIVAEQHRLSLVGALACVDAVILMDDLRPAKLIELLRPDIYIKGGDYSIDKLKSASLVSAYGGRCMVVPVEHEISSSAIIQRIEQLSLYGAPDPVKARIGAPIVFLDRDGTLITNQPFLNDPAKVELRPGVGEGLRALQDRGFRLVVVTNQQGIGLGYFDYATFIAVNSAMLRQLGFFGVTISKFYFCPHSLADSCDCRKPGSKLFENALRDFQPRVSDCVAIGDMPSDAAAAEKVGCRSILIGRGNPSTAAKSEVRSFAEAVDLVLSQRSRE